MTSVTLQELSDYVLMVMAMRPELAVNERNQALLTEILWLICTKQDYEISLDDLVALMKRHGISKQKSHLMRQLEFLRPGIDFMVKEPEPAATRRKPGPAPKCQLLTIEAFKMIALRAKTPIRNLLTQYYLLAEKEFRDEAMQGIQTRRALQSPSATLKTEQKLIKMRHERFRVGPCNYIIGLFDAQGKLAHLKEGWCGDMNTRYPKLVAQYYGFAVKVLFHMLTKNNPLAVEQCSFNNTPSDLRSPYDREIVDTPLETAIENMRSCNSFMTKEKTRNENEYSKTHRSVHDESRDLWSMDTITE